MSSYAVPDAHSLWRRGAVLFFTSSGASASKPFFHDVILEASISLRVCLSVAHTFFTDDLSHFRKKKRAT